MCLVWTLIVCTRTHTTILYSHVHTCTFVHTHTHIHSHTHTHTLPPFISSHSLPPLIPSQSLLPLPLSPYTCRNGRGWFGNVVASHGSNRSGRETMSSTRGEHNYTPSWLFLLVCTVHLSCLPAPLHTHMHTHTSHMHAHTTHTLHTPQHTTYTHTYHTALNTRR